MKGFGYMTEKYIKLEQIIMHLSDIKGYIDSYTFFLNHPNETIDIEEINMYLFTIPEIIETIKKLLIEFYEEENQ